MDMSTQEYQAYIKQKSPRSPIVKDTALAFLIGGAIFPPIMGAAADVAGQFGGILVMAIGCLYVLAVGFAYKVLESGKKPVEA